MILGIMQPYFFPYLGYFDLLNRTDRWLVFDIVRYRNKTWMNRNRIHHPDEGWMYISLPVNKHGRDSLICDIDCVDVTSARQKLVGQLEHYRRRAEYYDRVIDLVNDSFRRAGGSSLVEVNMAAMLAVCDYLGIENEVSVCSAMDLALPDIDHPGQWALEISSLMGAERYVNPPNGREIFEPSDFRARGIDLEITGLVDYHYDCSPYEFVSCLSVLDVLMFNAPEDVKAYLDGLI